MKDTSILIPTCKRPHFLVTALESVARQTAVDRIGEIVVMENGGNRESEKVCQKFPNLPIKYIFRDPLVPVSDLTVAVLRESSLPNVAMLHDDDWWFDFHLERGLGNLDSHPNVSAVYSSHFTSEGENSWYFGLNGNFFSWFANDQSVPGEARILNHRQVLVASILLSGNHMSSLMYRNSVIQLCLPAFANGNPYDNDRTLACELSRHGDIYYHDKPSMVIRHHLGSEDYRLRREGLAKKWFKISTNRMVALARDQSIDLRAEIASRIFRPGFGPEKAFRRIGLEPFDGVGPEVLLTPELLKIYRKLKQRERIGNAFDAAKRFIKAGLFLGN